MPALPLLCILLLLTSTVANASNYLSASYQSVQGHNLEECASKLNEKGAGWCEIRQSDRHPSISGFWPKVDQRTRMVSGPVSVLQAWNSSAFDKKGYKLYFMGGGHADYGGNEVYEFDMREGKWTRLTDPSPLNKLYIAADYNSRPQKNWRRLCWMPDVRIVPGSAHTYDGLIFSTKTGTLFLFVMRTANGSCFEDRFDKYRDSADVLGDRHESVGWYEFNPDKEKSRNELSPLTWRKVFTFKELNARLINRGFPVTAEVKNGDLVFGSKFITRRYDPKTPVLTTSKPFSSQPDLGDGSKIYDKYRNIVWSLHGKILLAFDGDSGQLLHKIDAKVPHGKSIAIAKDKKLYSWDGAASITVFDPDGERIWRTLEWGTNGPPIGNIRVYGKWVYLEDEDLFVGLSTHETGVWVYKHPQRPIYTVEYLKTNPQKLIDLAPPGDVITIPPGTYPVGLFINKSLTLRLRGVSLRGTVNHKGIINVKCNGCDVTIEDFHADGLKAHCQWGNCAAIKAEGKKFHLTLKKAHIGRTVMGVLTDNRGGELMVLNSVIENTGLGSNSDTLGHGLYAGIIDKVVVKNSVIRSSFNKGHLFKSRAPDTLIEHSVLAGMQGRHSRIVDFPCGGKLSILNSVLQQGDQTDNVDLIGIGTEPDNCGGNVHPSEVTVKHNWLIFDRDQSADEPTANYGFNRIFTWRAPLLDLDISNNRIIESTGRLMFSEGDIGPDLEHQNKIYKGRKAAGLGPGELPKI